MGFYLRQVGEARAIRVLSQVRWNAMLHGAKKTTERGVEVAHQLLIVLDSLDSSIEGLSVVGDREVALSVKLAVTLDAEDRVGIDSNLDGSCFKDPGNREWKEEDRSRKLSSHLVGDGSGLRSANEPGSSLRKDFIRVFIF